MKQHFRYFIIWMKGKENLHPNQLFLHISLNICLKKLMQVDNFVFVIPWYKRTFLCLIRFFGKPQMKKSACQWKSWFRITLLKNYDFDIQRLLSSDIFLLGDLFSSDFYTYGCWLATIFDTFLFFHQRVSYISWWYHNLCG